MAPQQNSSTARSQQAQEEIQKAPARNFLDLPPELRLQIYAEVLSYENFKYITRPVLLQSSDFILNETFDLYCKRLAKVISESERLRRTSIKQERDMLPRGATGQQMALENVMRAELPGKIKAAEKRTNSLMKLARGEA